MNSQVDNSFVIWIFQFCSFLTPIKSSKFHLQAIGSFLWCFGHFVLANLQLVIIYIRHNDTFHDGSTIGKILDIIQVVGPISAHIVMLIETNLNRSIQMKMWNLIFNVENQATLLAKEKYKYFGIFVIEIVIIMFMCNITEAFILSTITENARFARSWHFRLWSLHMLRIGVIQLVFYMEWIRFHVKIINNELLKINPDEADSLIVIANMRKMYSDIYLFSVYLNERFSWSILALMVHFFLALIISFYWIVANLYFGVLRFIFASSVICVSPMTSLLVIIYACEYCFREVSWLKKYELSFFCSYTNLYFQVSALGHSIHRLNLKNESPRMQSLVYYYL